MNGIILKKSLKLSPKKRYGYRKVRESTWLEQIKYPVKGKVKLVKRKYGKVGDRRKIKLEPTQEGKELYGKMWSDLLLFFDEIIKEVGEEEIQELTSLLEKFNNVTEEKIKILIDPELCNESCED